MTAVLRPTVFDQRIVEYLPGLEHLSRSFRSKPEDQEDLVAETVAYCLENWENYREDGGFWGWLMWSMRGIAGRTRFRKSETPVDPHRIAKTTRQTMPAQEASADLHKIVPMLDSDSGGILLRNATGESLVDIAKDFVGGAESMRQRRDRRRTKLIRELGLADAASA